MTKFSWSKVDNSLKRTNNKIGDLKNINPNTTINCLRKDAFLNQQTADEKRSQVKGQAVNFKINEINWV